METNQINVLRFYPKYLNQQEINDPLLVIRDFYSIDWPPGHLEKLMEWRKCVIEDSCYLNGRESPAILLFTHLLNARLLEAVYLLSQNKQVAKLAKRIHLNYDAQLQREEEGWLYYPLYLSRAERINPYLAISNIFQIYTIEQYRDFLYEWLETGLSDHAADETLEAADIIYCYENLQKLYEAVWIIRQREIEPVIIRGLDKKVSETESEETAGFSLISVNCNFNEILTTDESVGLHELIKIILAEITSVQLISYLGTHPDPATYYILVVIDEKDKTLEHELGNKIEDNCRHLIDVHVLVHKSDAVFRALEGGNRFFIQALSANNICYQSPEIFLPEFIATDLHELKTDAQTYWKRWGFQGKAFLDAALQRFSEGDLNLTAFLFHQAVESMLSAILRVNLDYRLVNHNLSKMFRLTLIFTNDFRDLFDLNTCEDRQLFALLQNSYSAARYKDDFIVDKEQVKVLSEKVVRLHNIAEGFYDQISVKLQDNY